MRDASSPWGSMDGGPVQVRPIKVSPTWMMSGHTWRGQRRQEASTSSGQVLAGWVVSSW